MAASLGRDARREQPWRVGAVAIQPRFAAFRRARILGSRGGWVTFVTTPAMTNPTAAIKSSPID
jgi:hypothetical protein